MLAQLLCLIIVAGASVYGGYLIGRNTNGSLRQDFVTWLLQGTDMEIISKADYRSAKDHLEWDKDLWEDSPSPFDPPANLPEENWQARLDLLTQRTKGKLSEAEYKKKLNNLLRSDEKLETSWNPAELRRRAEDQLRAEAKLEEVKTEYQKKLDDLLHSDEEPF